MLSSSSLSDRVDEEESPPPRGTANAPICPHLSPLPASPIWLTSPHMSASLYICSCWLWLLGDESGFVFFSRRWRFGAKRPRCAALRGRERRARRRFCTHSHPPFAPHARAHVKLDGEQHAVEKPERLYIVG